MQKQILINLFVVACLLFSLSCSREEPIEKVPWSEKPLSRIVVKTDGRSGAGIRKVSYFPDGITIKKEQVIYPDGSEAEINYSDRGRIERIVERFPSVDAGSQGSLRRSTVFDRTGKPEIDQINRADGTAKALSMNVYETGVRIYRTIIFYSDGKTIREISSLDWQAQKLHRGWTLRDLKRMRRDGTVESETVRLPDGSFRRTVYGKNKKRRRLETWSPDRKVVRSTFYAGDGSRVLKRVDENPNEMTVTSFNQVGKVNHIHYWTPSIEVATVYTDDGIALYRQAWSVPYGEPGPVKAKISRVEEIRSRKGKSSTYYFYPDGKTVHYIVETERKPEQSIISTYSFGSDGSFEKVETEGNGGITVRNAALREDLDKVAEIDPAYLIFRPYERPASALSNRPLPGKIDDFD